MKTDTLSKSLEFLYTFIRAHYTRAELAVLLDTSQAVLSGKISQNRWMLSEIVKVIENKGYTFHFALYQPDPYRSLNYFLSSINTWGNDTKAISSFIKDHSMNSRLLSDIGLSSILQRAFKVDKNDIKWASLMKFVKGSGSDIYIKIQKDEIKDEMRDSETDASQQEIVPEIALEESMDSVARKSRQIVSIDLGYIVEL